MHVQCVVAGGGPAGMMLGLLLARAGVSVTVLEKHGDFLRDFRGDTIHPSTLEVMHELGLLEEFLKRPHQEVRHAEGDLGDTRIRVADFTHLPTHCKFLAFMPQWDFLDFLAEKARRFPSFSLRMNTEGARLIREGGRTVGVEVESGGHAQRLDADLVVGADGRDSATRVDAGLKPIDLGAPMDVLWFRLAFRQGESQAVLGRIERGGVLVMLFRGDYWQCALIIRKGTFEQVRREGLEAFRRRVATLAKREGADELGSWGDVKLLTVKVNRLKEWALPGLLFIGDAAHAMSPIGGVGINLAIQDAVATANLLATRLRQGRVTPSDLRRVQRRREGPARLTQRLQILIQERVFRRVLGRRQRPALP